MPHISTLPWAMVIAHAGADGRASYAVNPEDCTVVIQDLPGTGLTVVLPGPSSPRPPDDGDWYFVADPLGLLGHEGNRGCTIDGNGFSINGAGTMSLRTAFGWAGFQFDALNRIWIVVVGGVA